MRILFLEASSGQVIGGSLTGMLHLISGLDRSRFEPFVVLYESKPVVSTLVASGVPVQIFSKRRLPKEHGLQDKPGYRAAKTRPAVSRATWNARAAATFLLETAPAALRLRRILAREKPQIVHVCNGFRGNMDAIVAARLCRIPCVVHSKGFDKYSFVERCAARGVAAGVSMTRAIEEHNLECGVVAPRRYVIYDGLDLGAFKPQRSREQVRGEFGIAADAPVVGVVGNIQEWKGQRVLLEAVAALRERHPGVVALVVGGVHRSGLSYSDSLRAFVAERGMDGQVIFTGARDDVADLMNAMDVVAHTSVRAEPFGRVIIEGMSVGAAVVATRAGGVPEFVADGVDGLLVEPGDAAALERVLDRLFSDRELRSRLGAGARASAERFSVDNHVGEMVKVYEAIAGEGRGRS